MYEIKVIDQSKSIIGLSWLGKVTPQDVLGVNEELNQLFTKLNINEFDLLVNMSEITVLFPETQKEIVKHQAWLLQKGMRRAAVVVNSSVAKLQLKRTAKESRHQGEFHFDTPEEALTFLKDTSLQVV
ncbi:SpoIIAA family protein [Litchfieldia salsa]|uniref:STAS/SEC14 domain-containing protein n=1 Tax=Litchfieldia salsa TaxID=930152 RepID=A0A1H0U982_9BACI|nr:STAS/SEC14 domain-containing protein [Litchfieldia salsa]SDP62701.1 hypothetical protein SAMN05216565_104240 [Litchfieldia salsa]